MPWAYEVVAYVKRKPAGWVGVYLDKETALREAHRTGRPPGRVKRIQVSPCEADLMRQGSSWQEAWRRCRKEEIKPW